MALWDGRFDGSPDKILTEFSESISFDKRLYKYDIQGSKAHAQMLSESDIISPEAAKAIIDGLSDIEQKIDQGNFNYDITLEDIHMHIESALTEHIGDEGARLHTARSRNDQVALDFRLYLRDQIDKMTEGIKLFQIALLKQAAQNTDTILPGYTHLQRAQPVLFAHHLLAYVEMFNRDKSRLNDCKDRLNVMPLGSGALAGSTLKIQRDITCKLLNFPSISRNSMDAVADRDFACELLAALSIFGMHVSRLSEDIILWSSAEFNFIELADAFCTGSSLMPQKKNPDIAEIARGKTGRLFGNLISLLTILKGLPLTYNRDLQEDKEPVFDAIDTVEKLLAVYPPMIATMNVKKDIMLQAASDPALMATDLAERLVELGVPFRIAHHRVGSLVKWCKNNNKLLNQICLSEMKISVPEADNECIKLFTPEQSIKKRKVFGATAPGEVKKQIQFWSNTLK
ncbi:MAG: argininosuccinate lyase [bacterium]|nr:argininosuccinate lyase [bacterium]